VDEERIVPEFVKEVRVLAGKLEKENNVE